MNYAFKMILVLMALGVFGLQGCLSGAEVVSRVAIATVQTLHQESKRKKTYNKTNYNSKHFQYDDDDYICDIATYTKGNIKRFKPIHYASVQEAKVRGLLCDVKETDIELNISNLVPAPISFKNIPDNVVCDNARTTNNKNINVWNIANTSWVEEAKFRNLDCGMNKTLTNALKNASGMSICNKATIWVNGKKKWNDIKSNYDYISEAKNRGLDCNVNDNSTKVYVEAELKKKNNNNKIKLNSSDKLKNYGSSTIQPMEIYSKKWTSSYICIMALDNNGNWETKDSSKHFVQEAIARNLDCSKENNELISKQIKILNSKKEKELKKLGKPIFPSIQWTSQRDEIISKYKKLIDNINYNYVTRFSDNTKNKPTKITIPSSSKKIDNLNPGQDYQKPIINAFVRVDGSMAIIQGTVTDNTEVEEVLIDNLQVVTFKGGVFEFKEYIPRSGKTIEIVAYDRKGNKATKVLKLERGNIQQASGPKFDTLNPSGKRVKSNPNALALIIGVANYEKTPANALYADKDAQQFYDYATMKLGIPAKNIKELVNNKADRVEIGLAIQDWIARSTKQGKTDIYIFFAGHGLASQDGKNMFLLPYDGSPRLLSASAIRRKELFDNIQKANPRSVTVFLDTCYSGVTRNEEMLIAGRPIVIKAKEQAIPDGFTLFSAASNEQISKPLEEAKHGMFSYFLMKGMEGDADSNNDKKITALELHNYVRENVVQQSSGSQTPELQGDKDRVLVQFN